MEKELSARELIEHIAPSRVRDLMGQAVRQGYEHVNYALGQFEFFNWQIGQQVRGYAQFVTIQWVLKQMSERRVLPFSPRIECNTRKNYSFLEFLTNGAVIAIARSEDPSIPGRYAKFRSVRSLSNCIPLFDMEPDSRPPFLLMSFGASGDVPSFARVGVPTEGCRSWHDYEDILKNSQRVAADVTDIADPREAVQHALEVINYAAKKSSGSNNPG